jgi:hypothetical protein
MTDRKAKKRTRNAAGYTHVSGYAQASQAPAIQDQLMSAEEVDREIAKKERDDGN